MKEASDRRVTVIGLAFQRCDVVDRGVTASTLLTEPRAGTDR